MTTSQRHEAFGRNVQSTVRIVEATSASIDAAGEGTVATPAGYTGKCINAFLVAGSVEVNDLRIVDTTHSENGITGVVLLNSNPATIMTDPETAPRTYVEPITLDALTKIIEQAMARG